MRSMPKCLIVIALLWAGRAAACTLPVDGAGSYIDNGASVTDNVTGLTWLKTTSQGYTRQYTYAQAAASLPAGWRLPTLPEAWTIENLQSRDPVLGSIFGPIVSYPYPSTIHVNYWTSTPAPNGGLMAVNYNGGGAGPLAAASTAYLRVVSGSWNCLPFAPHDNGDGTWSVPSTGQMWAHLAGEHTWNDLPMLAGGCYDGYCDWRAPGEKELETMWTVLKAMPWAWSDLPDFGAIPPTCAWGLSLQGYHDDRRTLHDVWLVRG